jgi:uncharacterized protein (DUF362 family)
MSAKRSASRRDFLKECFSGVALLRASDTMGLLAPVQQAALPAKSKVVIARDDLLRGTGSTVDSRRMLSLLDRAMQTLFDRDHSIEAWSKLVRPGETVGVKVNALGGRGLSSNLQLVEAICGRLQEAGIKASDIVVWDRDSNELEHSGFHLSMGGNAVQCFGTDRVDYEHELVTHGSVGSRLSRILTQRCNVLINVPVLKDHDGAGVTISLKNLYGVIHNPNKYHPNGCNPYIADLNMLPEIRTRMRLTLCDATTAQYEGGPAYKPEYSWRHNALIVSQDPVALDYTGWQIIERKRAEKGLKTLEAEGRAPHYIATAADAGHQLGTNDPGRITVAEV